MNRPTAEDVIAEWGIDEATSLIEALDVEGYRIVHPDDVSNDALGTWIDDPEDAAYLDGWRACRLAVFGNDAQDIEPQACDSPAICDVPGGNSSDGLRDPETAEGHTEAETDYPELSHIARGVGCRVLEDTEAQCARALNEINRMRALAWTLKQLVPGHWWTSPPNQATADVLQGIKASGDETERSS